jgi:hypothetical protein
MQSVECEVQNDKANPTRLCEIASGLPPLAMTEWGCDSFCNLLQ